MSLNAVVYKNYKNLEFPLDLSVWEIDEETGEIYTDVEGVKLDNSSELLIACSCWLGNSSTISFIKDKIFPIFHNNFPNSILLNKVLYSGSHSGDYIEVNLIKYLEKEIIILKRETNQHLKEQILDKFIQDIEQLVKAAKEQNNPIVFL
jgi:hypothetical protein